MAEDETTQETQDIPAVEPEPDMSSSSKSPWEAHVAGDSGDDPLPIIGAAFAGGFVLPKILKKLGGGDD